MNWLSRIAGLTERLRLDVLMSFDMKSGQGTAGLHWIILKDPPAPLEPFQSALVGLLYARTLVNHLETRTELFDRMSLAAAAGLDGDSPLTFDPWTLKSAGQGYSIWPWTLRDAATITNAMTYTATLLSTSHRKIGINLKMAFGLERILAPSAPLIAAHGLSATLDQHGRAYLARILFGISRHYQSPDNVRMRSEPDALAESIRWLAPSPESLEERG